MVDTRSRDLVITSDWLQVRNNSSSSWELFSGNLVPMVDTLLASSPGTNIHFIVITDQWTLKGEYNYVKGRKAYRFLYDQ